MQVCLAGNGLVWFYGNQALNTLASIHTKAKSRETVRQRTPSTEAGYKGGRGLEIGVIRVKELWICLATQAGIFTGYIRIDGKFFFIKVLIEELFSESKDIGVHIFTTFLKLLS
jgi:hypothetical protein